MSSLNQVQLIGNMGADPEIRTSQSGKKVATLRIATSEKWRDRNSGEQKERTEWHRVVVFQEGLVGVIEQYVKKGDKVFVQGALQTRKWEKDGQDHYATEVVLSGFDAKLVMLSSGGKSDNAPASRPSNNQPAFEPGGMDDDLPF